MRIYTIGFTQKPASRFFGLLQEHGIRRLVDIRLHNVSQLAGFAKRDDLAYFLAAIAGATYEHEPLLAPTQELLDQVKKRRGDWDAFAEAFTGLLAERRVESVLERTAFATPTVLLCSEAEAERCHRRLMVEYLAERWGDVEAVHLG